MKTDSSSLRERIKCDFDLDLPIGAGGIASRDDALVILTSDPSAVAMTQMLVLRCIGTALGRLWRVVARNPLEGTWSNIDQVQIDAIELAVDQDVTLRINYYFDVGALVADKAASHRDRRLLPPAAYIDAASGIVFPYQVGWLNFDAVDDNEPTHPGLGRTISYSALNSKGTVSIFDYNVRDFPKSFDVAFLEPQFVAAAYNIFRFNANVTPDGERIATRSSSGLAYLRQDFMIDGHRSVLALTAVRGQYFKVRASWRAEPLFDDVGNEFLDLVFHLASTGGRLQ